MTDHRDDPETQSPGEPEGGTSVPDEATREGDSVGDDTSVSTGPAPPDRDEERAGASARDQRAASDGHPPTEGVPAPTEQPIRWYLTSRNGLVIASRDVVTSLLAVAVIGLVLFAISGVWPPLVAIESGSMEPNMEKGDLVFLVESDRYAPGAADDTGIVTARNGAESSHESFNRPGNVIVYKPNGRDGTPIIHRTIFSVSEGEDWYDKTESRHVGTTDSCAALRYCRAEHAGYVTRGDANRRYDQVGLEPQSDIVRPQWVEGKAVARIPYLGCIRLELTGGPSCF
jgi:signal peptidase